MLREIEFRGKYRGKWRYGYLCRNKIRDCMVIQDSSYINTNVSYSFDQETLGQYTGLKDKNGVKIFENDIVKMHQFLFDGEEYESEITGVIKYSPATMSYHLDKIKNKGVKKYMGHEEDDDVDSVPICDFIGLHEDSWTVIGNVFDNGGLINEN